MNVLNILSILINCI